VKFYKTCDEPTALLLVSLLRHHLLYLEKYADDLYTTFALVDPFHFKGLKGSARPTRPKLDALQLKGLVRCILNTSMGTAFFVGEALVDKLREEGTEEYLSSLGVDAVLIGDLLTNLDDMAAYSRGWEALRERAGSVGHYKTLDALASATNTFQVKRKDFHSD